jgi:hypothetical protein
MPTCLRIRFFGLSSAFMQHGRAIKAREVGLAGGFGIYFRKCFAKTRSAIIKRGPPLLDKAIGPLGLPSLRSALALSAAACKEFIVIGK